MTVSILLRIGSRGRRLGRVGVSHTDTVENGAPYPKTPSGMSPREGKNGFSGWVRYPTACGPEKPPTGSIAMIR